MMLENTGQLLANSLKRIIPDPFVFVLLITLLTGGLAYLLTDFSAIQILHAWHEGFWLLLEFTMQMILLLATGFCIALSPAVRRVIDYLASFITTPTAVYATVTLTGALLALVSWSWIVVTAVLARELAGRVKKVDYPYLSACVYLTIILPPGGLSNPISLVLSTDNNFLIKTGVLSKTIPIHSTLGSTLNFCYSLLFVLLLPLLMVWLRPKENHVVEMNTLKRDSDEKKNLSIEKEAESLRLPGKAFSDTMNSSSVLQGIVGLCGCIFITYYFTNKGFNLNLNIMIFIFLILGLLLHRTPARYVLAMQRACNNLSGIVYQYIFYAGIMGIMISSGLAVIVSDWMTSYATVNTLPAIAYLSAGLVNFAIPSAGGEWAVIGPSLLEATKTLGENMSPLELNLFISRIALSTAYGETATNLLQPFFVLLILPVMGAGLNLQARELTGHLVIPFIFIVCVSLLLITWIPV